jgi:hypothetical protein
VRDELTQRFGGVTAYSAGGVPLKPAAAWLTSA